jgi:hypothetical protein
VRKGADTWRWRPLYRPGVQLLGVQAKGKGAHEVRLGLGLESGVVWLEEGDDGRVPPISNCGRSPKA